MNLPWVCMSSQSWIPLPPPTLYHLSGSYPCISPKHPVSCIEHRLAIRFLPDSLHVSLPFAQIIPPSPSPTESKSPFYTSVSLLLSCIEGYHYHLSKFHIYVLVYCIGVFLSMLLYNFFLHQAFIGKGTQDSFPTRKKRQFAYYKIWNKNSLTKLLCKKLRWIHAASRECLHLKEKRCLWGTKQ